MEGRHISAITEQILLSLVSNEWWQFDLSSYLLPLYRYLREGYKYYSPILACTQKVYNEIAASSTLKKRT
jgi:hypothetical protein